MIDNELILSDDEYNLINKLNERLPSVKKTNTENRSFSDEYPTPGSETDSISPTNFNHTSHAALNFNYADQFESLLKSNASSSYEVDSIENWLDNIQNNRKINPVNRTNSLKNGFMSLKVKPLRASRKLDPTANQFSQEHYLQSKKRSSSSTSFHPACNFLKIIEKPVQRLNKDQQARQVIRTSSITIDINDPDSAGKAVNGNGQIKIEKKIRLNYARPQDFSSVLNFGTLC